MKKVRKIALYLLGALLLVGIAGTILVSVYEEEIKQYALEKVDESLVTNMTVASMDFTLWDQFPQASVVFRDVLIEETFEEHDTLLFADKVFLQFDIFDMIGGDYIVKNVTIQHAALNIKRDATGADNYHFWKETEGGGNDLSFELDGVSLEDVHTRVQDDVAEFDLDLIAHDIALDGSFSQQAFDLEATADFFVATIDVGPEKYVSNKRILADLVMEINGAESAYYITSGDFSVEGMPFSATGSIMDQPDGVLCDLVVVGEEVDVEDVMKHLPESYRESIAAYRAKGDIDFQGSISGMANASTHPDILINYSINGARFTHHGSGVSMSDIRSSGRFEKENAAREKLTIDSFEADFESGSFRSSGYVAEFKRPEMDLELTGNFDLHDLKKFMDIDDLAELRGQFSVNARFAGTIQNPSQITPTDLKAARVSGVVQFSDAIFQLNNAPHAFESLRGKFSLDNRNASIQEFSGVVQESQFSLKGTFENFLPYLLIKEERLNIRADFASDGLDFNSLLSPGKKSSDYHLFFPPDIDFNLNLNVAQIKFREFEATDIEGVAIMDHQVFRVNPLSLYTAEGHFQSTAIVDGRNPNYFTLECQSHLESINITQLFEEFENFGQDFIRSEHLKGTATATADLDAVFSPALVFDPNKIVSVVDISVKDGELIDLTSMRNISTYVSDNHFIAPFVDEDALDEKLRHIYFATLENQIEIRNNKIFLPKMEIASSAMDISATGKHSFANRIDYTLGFKIRDVMSKSQETEFGVVEDDGLSNSFFLSMTGTSENPEFGYDRMAHKEKRKEDRQEEKQNVKALLKEELGLFKKDDTVGEYEEKKSGDGKVISITLADDKKKEEANDKPKKKRRGWLKDDDEEEEVVISLDDEDDDF